MENDSKYWERQYQNEKVGWDIGYISTPLKAYFDQLQNKELKILVPGAGNAYEVEYLYMKGFRQVYLLDFARLPVHNFQERLPDFPYKNLIVQDFWEHKEQYDLIVEQTFFSSLPRRLRNAYALKMHELLNRNGKLAGLLFNHEFGFDKPPLGGSEEEYIRLFKPFFRFIHFKTAYNSIKPRTGREIFILLEKKI